MLDEGNMLFSSEFFFSTCLLSKSPNKGWTRDGHSKLTQTIDSNGSASFIQGSGQPKSGTSEENNATLIELILSENDEPGSH